MHCVVTAISRRTRHNTLSCVTYRLLTTVLHQENESLPTLYLHFFFILDRFPAVVLFFKHLLMRSRDDKTILPLSFCFFFFWGLNSKCVFFRCQCLVHCSGCVSLHRCAVPIDGEASGDLRPIARDLSAFGVWCLTRSSIGSPGIQDAKLSPHPPDFPSVPRGCRHTCVFRCADFVPRRTTERDWTPTE